MTLNCPFYQQTFEAQKVGWFADAINHHYLCTSPSEVNFHMYECVRKL